MRNRFLHKEHGQVIIWFALAVPLLILFTALAVNMGIIYTAKAKLSNATDSAVLTGIRNYPAGKATAQNLATDIFQANYGSTTPTLNYTWCESPTCPTVNLKLHATTTVNTTFMTYLPNRAQWTIGDTAASTRSNLVMSIILDRSGSMQTNGGGTALKAAVPIFINNFIDGTDHVALLSYASNATINVAMTKTFKSAVNSAVSSMSFVGATFGSGSGSNPVYTATNGPPLTMADTQNNSVTFPSGTPETKVVIYFTDGLMNAVQDRFHCSGNNTTWTVMNYGGHDSPTSSQYAAILDPVNSTNYGDATSSGFIYDSHNDYCRDASGNVKTFPSQKKGGALSFLQTNVTEEAKYRGIQTANAMRAESPVPTYIYVIGLGSTITGDACTEAFLATLANDPGAAKYKPGAPCTQTQGVYDSTKPPGLFYPVGNCPSAQCTQDLTTAFQAIAAMVLTRLSQ